MTDDLDIVAFPENQTAGSLSFLSSRKGSTNMRSDLVDQASKIIPEPPVLINLVSRRVKQLNLGRAPLIRTDHKIGAADIALMEIIERKIAPNFPDGYEEIKK
jgi:DNA-directed RNA polymerase subunit omega